MRVYLAFIGPFPKRREERGLCLAIETTNLQDLSQDHAGTFTFMHLADAFIQSDLQCIQVIHFLSVHVQVVTCE